RGVDVQGGHLGEHETRDRRDRCGTPKQREVDRTESVGIVRVPKDRRSPRTSRAEDRRGRDGRVRGLPVLEEQDRAYAEVSRCPYDVGKVWRDRDGEILSLAVLAVVEILGEVGVDALAQMIGVGVSVWACV